MDRIIQFSTHDKVLSGLFIECKLFKDYITFFTTPPRRLNLKQVERNLQDVINTITNVLDRFKRWSACLQRMKDLCEFKYHLIVIRDKLFIKDDDMRDLDALNERWNVSQGDIIAILEDILDMFQRRNEVPQIDI